MSRRPGRSTPPNPERVSVHQEVPFHDVDALEVVWHGHYYKYLEIARTALFRTLGLQNLAEEFPYRWVIVESKCRHAFPLRFADRMRVDAWLEDIDHRILVAYEVHNLTAGKRAARAHTVLATLDGSGTLLLKTPEPLLSRLRAPG